MDVLWKFLIVSQRRNPACPSEGPRDAFIRHRSTVERFLVPWAPLSSPISLAGTNPVTLNQINGPREKPDDASRTKAGSTAGHGGGCTTDFSSEVKSTKGAVRARAFSDGASC